MQFYDERFADRWLANSAGCDLNILLADRGDDVAGSEAPGRDFVRIEPNAHGVIARTEDLD